MGDRFRDSARGVAKGAVNAEVEDRLVSPLARKVSGCVSVLVTIFCTALGAGAVVIVGHMGGDIDSVGPVALGIGLIGGIVVGAFLGGAVGGLVRRLLTR